jgi:hypothetical protein
MRFDVLGHYILSITDGSWRGGAAFSLRFKFFLADTIDKIIQWFSSVTKLNLKAVTFVSFASAA